MNISGYIAANSWGYDVAKASQTTSTKSFTISTEEQKATTQKTLNNANTNPFEAGSFNFKDWCSKLDPSYDRQMFTKTEPTRSDEEILKDMAELAKKHVQQGTFQEGDKEFLALMKEYISSVSPDRESILNRAVNEIIERTNQGEDYTMSDIYQQVKSQIAAQKEEDEEEKKKEKKEPIDYFIEALKNRDKGKSSSGGAISNITQNDGYNEVTIDQGGGKTTTLGYANGELINTFIGGNNYKVLVDNYGGSAKYGSFKDDNGVMIAAFGGSEGENDFRFHSCPTDAEIERQKEVLSAYNAGYDFTNGIYRGGHSEAYDKTYERLTSYAYA